jgi:LacI family transcriptional regulator
MAITIKDIAKKTGYTVATVSRALNDSPMVSDKTKIEISNAANKMGYVRNNIARGLVTNHLTTVGIIVPDITNPYFPRLIKGAQDTLQESGYNTFLCNNNGIIENEVKHIEMLCSLCSKGIIMDPLSDDSYEHVRKINPHIPVVFVGNCPAAQNINYIAIDNYKGGVKATKYLIGLGHKKIAYIGGNENTNTNRARFKGFRDVMLQHFGTLDNSLIKFNYPDMSHGFEEAANIIQEGNIPTAIVASNDLIALGIIDCLWKHGFDIPNDISIIGFDNIEYSSLPGINLTTVAEPRYEIGAMAAETILKLFDSDEPLPPVQIDLDPELIIRKTCAKAKN